MLSLLHWNVLAGAYSTSASFPLADPRDLDPAERAPKILFEILGHEPAIICLNEFDAILGDLLRPRLSLAGYDSITEGDNCIAWRADTVRYKRHEIIELLPKSAIAVRFDNALWVVATHLKAGLQNAHIRAEQANMLVKQLSTIVPPNEAVILAGDLNADPYEEIITKILPDEALRRVQIGGPTASKIRETGGIMTEQRRTIDYIFTRGVKITSTFSGMPMVLPPRRFPSAQMPSDHVPLVISFEV